MRETIVDFDLPSRPVHWLIRRIYHPYTLWEDWHNGMWRRIGIEERKKFLDKSIEFTGNAELYGKWMIDVANLWKYSCEHNLTNGDINRKAWIGHAACSVAINCPEDVTREAWGHLSKQQQSEANSKADNAILYWERRFIQTIIIPCQKSQLELMF